AQNLAWSESTTFATKPALDGPTTATQGAVAAGQVVEFDVTPAVTADGTVSFALTTSATDDVVYRSREATSGQPQLVVQLRDPTVTIITPAVGSVVAAGTNVTFTATAHDVHGANLSGLVQWTSNQEGFLGTGASISHTLGSGAHTITASVTDANQATGSASVL